MNEEIILYYMVKIFHDKTCRIYKNGVDYTAGLNFDFCCIEIYLN